MEAVLLQQIWVCPCVIYSLDEAGNDETDTDMLARAEKCREKCLISPQKSVHVKQERN